MRRLHVLAAVALAGLSMPFDLAGQGTLSTQGFGYPTGELSARARATGGSLGQFDPDSPINPAAIGTSVDPRMYLQYEPELRRLSTDGETVNAIIARFSLASISVPFGSRGSVGISAATFLDRSAETSFSRQQSIDGQNVTVRETTRTLGAINDVRLAVGFSAGQKVQIGFGGHVFVGQNRMFFIQSFPDAPAFTPISQVSTLGFTGFAASAGVLVKPSSILGFSLAARKGFGIDAKAGDSTVSQADIPDRYSAAITYEGIPGSSISAQVSRDTWSSLNGLGSADATAVDGWEGGLGIEALGPRIAARQTVLRLGGRYRTLPFLAGGSEVDEMSFGGGLGAQFFRNRATFDFSVERASRSPKLSSVEASERAYIFSFGLRVRP
ncbi:MAG: hypothetical protein ACSLFK_15660 [Gemmatimonadaceae bacterium]